MIKVFVEGKDKFFIEAYIAFLTTNLAIPRGIDFDVIPLGGWTNLTNASNTVKENSDLGGKNILIFDADSELNSGGFNIRKKEIEKIKAENNLAFELFLFPDNSTNGDFESLLEMIINQKHAGVLECFSIYEECIAKYNKPNSPLVYKLPIRKSKIYSFVDAFPKSKSDSKKFKQGDFFFQNNEMWDFESSKLNPLKEFLTKELTNHEH
jgi:hypothetical protein